MGLSQRARAWTVLALPALAWLAFQQGLGWVLRVACSAAWVGIAWGVASLAVCALAAWLGRPLSRGPGQTVHSWLAHMALLGCGVFGLAIAFQTLAVVLVPPCAR